MIGLFAKVIFGIAAAGLASATAYGVYKLITRDLVKREISSKIQDDDTFKEYFKDAFKAKYKQKEGEAYTFTVMDQWDEPLVDVILNGDEISSDIKPGDEIILI